MKDIKEYILNEAQDINWYYCFFDKKNKKMYNWFIGEFPKNSLGKKQAEDSINDPWDKMGKGDYKYLGVLNRDEISKKCPNDYEYCWG